MQIHYVRIRRRTYPDWLTALPIGLLVAAVVLAVLFLLGIGHAAADTAQPGPQQPAVSPAPPRGSAAWHLTLPLDTPCSQCHREEYPGKGRSR